MSPSQRSPLVIAHRGASAYRPENTLGAYELALEQHADMVEIDLHMSRDGVVVVAHDADLGHFGAKGMIEDRSLAELKQLNAGHGTTEEAEIPTLDEVLEAFGQRTSFNLEIKWGANGHYPGLEAAVLAALQARGLLERTLFSSFRDSILAELRRLCPEARLALLLDPRQPEPRKVFERAEVLGAEAVNPHFALADSRLIETAHSSGLSVYAYTVDDANLMGELIERGVDGIFTNAPDRMRGLLGPATR